MITVDYAPPRYRLSSTRRVIGAVLCLASLAVVVAYGAARFYPDNVFLKGHFRNFLTGSGELFVLSALISIAVFPVRNSAVQRVRPLIRFALITLAAVSFVGAGLTHGFAIFTYRPTVVATSPDAMRRVALINVGPYQELHIWAGTGLSAKDVGNLGPPCEFNTAKFTSDNEVLVSTSFGDYDIHLDPATGAPLNGLTHTCTV
jgi:hypothetical protein